MSACAASEYTLIIRSRDALSMKVISPDTHLVVCGGNDQVICRANRTRRHSSAGSGTVIAVCLALGLSLSACGNKGDLYLQKLELSEEQQKLLDDLEEETVKKKQSGNTATPE